MAKKKPPLKSSIDEGIKSAEEANKLIKEKVGHGDVFLADIDKIDEIEINGKPMHNRVFYSQEKIIELANGIKKQKGSFFFGKGLMNPIVLRKSKLKEGRWERVAGFRRKEAFIHNEETKIPAIEIECDDITARFLRNEENFNREDLNIYDRVYSDAEYIAMKIGLSDSDELRTFLQQYKSHNDKQKSFKLDSEQLKKIDIVENTIRELARDDYKTVSSFHSKLDIFNYNINIQKAIIDKKLNVSQANEINKLKNDKSIVNVINMVCEYKEVNHKDMTKKAVKDIVDGILGKMQASKHSVLSEAKSYFDQIKVGDLKALDEDVKLKAEKLIEKSNNNLKEVVGLIRGSGG